MALVTGRENVLALYQDAAQKKWVLPCFCTENLTTTEALLCAVAEHGDKIGIKDLPVIVAITNLYDHRAQTPNYTHTRRWDIGLQLFMKDVAILAAVVRHHLLLPSTATRRDPTDPAVVEAVAQELDHNRVVAELLGALAQADGAATGPAVWSDWKAGLVAALTARVVGSIGGTPVAARSSTT